VAEQSIKRNCCEKSTVEAQVAHFYLLDAGPFNEAKEKPPLLCTLVLDVVSGDLIRI
jgi:hypothetical protein